MLFLYFTLYNPTADATRNDLKGAKGYLTNFFKSCGVLDHALFARILLLYNKNPPVNDMHPKCYRLCTSAFYIGLSAMQLLR